jgi:CheY-like chemotaxis protein
VIVKQLVEAMAGRIIVSSTIGRGSSFLLVFPRTGAAVAAPAAAPAPAVPLPAHERPATILYVEDNPANVALVRASLALNPNIRLEIAIDGYQGLAAARRLQPDLILLDINLPGMDGFALMQHLRADRTLSMVPCIALSANAMNSEIERAQACGFSDYITKPFDVRALLATIDKHLRRVAPAA